MAASRAVCDDKGDGIAPDKGGHGVNGGAARRPEDRAHEGIDEDTDEFHEAKACEKRKEEGPDGDDEADRNGKLIEKERADIAAPQPGVVLHEAKVKDSPDDGAADLCDGHKDVHKGLVPGLCEKRPNGPDIHDAQDEDAYEGHGVFLETYDDEVYRHTFHCWTDPLEIEEEHKNAK